MRLNNCDQRVTDIQAPSLTSVHYISFTFVKVNELKCLHLDNPICWRQKKLWHCMFSHQFAVYLQFILLSLFFELLASFEKLQTCVHFVEIGVLAVVSMMLSLLPFQPDFLFLLSTCTLSAEPSRDHSDKTVPVFYISVKVSCLRCIVALLFYKYIP